MLLFALGATRVTRHLFSIPTPAVFLLGAAVAGQIVPSLRQDLPILAVERIGVVALILILFDGGMEIGWRRAQASAAPIVTLGLVGTLATAAIIAVLGHWIFDLGWTSAWLLGAALAPTDPAVMFSVLGGREIEGRSGTILQGEAGFNDPVGIALTLGLVELATSSGSSAGGIALDVLLQLAIGVAIGLAGGRLLVEIMRHISLPGAGLYPLRTLAGAGIIYGLTDLAHGSGFLAVFVAGMLVGDAEAPYRAEIGRFHSALASLAEITVFVALGLTIQLSALGEGNLWLDALAIGALTALVARPLVVAPLLVPARLRWGERTFIMWSGLKGAVPILLAAFAVTGGVSDGRRIYDIVFVVVALSVVVQGTSIPLVARALGIPMRAAEPAPIDAPPSP